MCLRGRLEGVDQARENTHQKVDQARENIHLKVDHAGEKTWIMLVGNDSQLPTDVLLERLPPTGLPHSPEDRAEMTFRSAALWGMGRLTPCASRGPTPASGATPTAADEAALSAIYEGWVAVIGEHIRGA